MSTTFSQVLWPSDVEHGDRMTASAACENLDDRATFARRLAEEKAKIDVEIEQDLEAIRNRVRKPTTEEEIAASHARVLAENARFMERLERGSAELDAKNEAKFGEAGKAKRAKWIAESRSPLKQFRLSLDANVLMGMTTDITEPVEKRARLVRPRHFVVSSSDNAASTNTIENATPVRQEAFDNESLIQEYACANSFSSPAVPGASEEPSHVSSSLSCPPEALDPLSYLLNQATTTRLQLHAIESSINSILAETTWISSATSISDSLTWSSSCQCYELQTARPAALSFDVTTTQSEHEHDGRSEAWHSARDFPDENENADDEVEEMQKMLDAGQEWMKVTSEVMDGMKSARCTDAEV